MPNCLHIYSCRTGYRRKVIHVFQKREWHTQTLIKTSLELLHRPLAHALLPVGACVMRSLGEEAPSPRDDSTPCDFLVRPSDAGGLGGFAARDFARGDLITEEAPLAHWRRSATESLHDVIAGLDRESREAFLELCAHGCGEGAKTVEGIWASNAFSVPEASGHADFVSNDASADPPELIFAHIARLNHCCRPNAHHTWDPSRGVKSVHALRDIAVGEEILLSYIGGATLLHVPRERRQAALHQTFGFVCACARCAAGDEADDAKWREEVGSAAEVLRDTDGDPILVWSHEVYMRSLLRS